MAWIKSYQSLERHPKLHDLKAIMNWGHDEAIGKLHRLWWWSLEYAEDGDLSKHPPSRISTAMGIPPDSSNHLIQTLIDVKFLDSEPFLHIHDWWAYSGEFLTTKYRHYESKWKRIKRLYNKCKTCSKNLSKTVSKTPSKTGSKTGQDKIRKDKIKDLNLKDLSFPDFEREDNAKLQQRKALLQDQARKLGIE